MITAQQFMDLCSDLFDDARRYSGRGMYGAECVGIVPRNSSMLSIGAQIMAAAHDTGNEICANTLRAPITIDTSLVLLSVNNTDSLIYVSQLTCFVLLMSLVKATYSLQGFFQ